MEKIGHCEYCNNPISSERRFCSRKCARRSVSKPATPHNCLFCKQPLIQQDSETNYSFNARKHCNRECALNARLAKSQNVKPNICKQCGEKIFKRVAESVNRYHNRKFCSQICTKTYLKEHELGWYANGAMKFSYKEKKKDEDLPPIIWTDQEFKDFYSLYPELNLF